MVHRHPNVFTIAPGTAFLPTVADALASGQLVKGFSFGGDPLALTDATIYVPTRRAARELRSAFLDCLGGETVLLPRIRPLGEFDDDSDVFAGAADDMLALPPAIDSLERQVLLGSLIARWSEGLNREILRLYSEPEIKTPVSTADAYWMAADLCALIDQMHTEGASFQDVGVAAEVETSEWWMLTLRFLDIVKTHWPGILAERNRLDPADHRDRMIRAEARRLKERPPTQPVIVAGSTGSVAATAELIAAVARLPRGAVVLPGYDRDMDGKTRAALERPLLEPGIVSHPQFSLHTLTRRINVDAAAIETLGVESPALAARRRWVSRALKPSETTGTWVNERKELAADAFARVSAINAYNERSEAAAIAAALRETVHEPGKTAALVTTDRTLARRVIGELAIYGIVADDSGGTPFDLTAPGRLLQLAIDVAFSLGGPETLLALLKHPLVHVGADRNRHSRAASLFEQMVLRGSKGRFDAANVVSMVETHLTETGEQSRKPDWMERVDAYDFDEVRALAARLEDAFAPLASVHESPGKSTIAACVTATISTVEALAADDAGRFEALYSGSGGDHLAAMLRRLLAIADDVAFAPLEWPQILPALAGRELVKPEPGGHPRVFIWGALEARLQTVDRIVLGGLNEGTWPSQTANDAFLTRAQKEKIGLMPPERRIGLSAHDFQMAMGQPEVILSRADRAEGAPAVPSRWWQRLMTLAGTDAENAMIERGNRFITLAERAFARPTELPAERPRPAPPLVARPNRFSVTEINTLKSDPYAIYAKKILRLKEVDPLIRDPDASDRGILIHAILERAVQTDIDFMASDAEEQVEALAHQLFDEEGLPPEIHAMWWPRFALAIKAYVDWERKREPDIRERSAEVMSVPVEVESTGVSLTGRADRIDVRADGLADIIDYKTGKAPSGTDISKLLAPQMPLEAALVRRGGFKSVRPRDTNAMIHITFGPRGEVDDKPFPKPDAKDPKDPNEIAETAWKQIIGLLEKFADETTGYESHTAVQPQQHFSSPYDHLARVLEWSAGESDDAGDA